jgi:hypothetical protein
MYLLKDETFENIWWRIENRVHELAEVPGALDMYHVTNILRAFSRSQQNHQAGSDKLFIHLEPIILKNIDSIPARDLSHIAYAYSVRAAGNPELYKALERRLEDLADQGDPFDYPSLHNLLYFLMFRDITNEKIWKHMIESTL